MDLKTLIALCAAFVAVAVFAGWRGAQPPNPMKGPRMIPWRFIMFTSAAVAIVLFGMMEKVTGIHPPR